MTWDEAAKYCHDTYGSYVDEEERFFVCPECEEPLYESDYEDIETWGMCPVCDYNFKTEQFGECSCCSFEGDDEDE